MPDTLWGWPQGFTEQDRTGKLWRDSGAMYILLFFLKQATQAHFLALEIWEIILGESAAYIVFPPQRFCFPGPENDQTLHGNAED